MSDATMMSSPTTYHPVKMKATGARQVVTPLPKVQPNKVEKILYSLFVHALSDEDQDLPSLAESISVRNMNAEGPSHMMATSMASQLVRFKTPEVISDWMTLLSWMIDALPKAVTTNERYRIMSFLSRFSAEQAVADQDCRYWKMMVELVQYSPFAWETLQLITHKDISIDNVSAEERAGEIFNVTTFQGDIIYPDQWLAFALDTSLSAKDREELPFSVLIQLVKAFEHEFAQDRQQEGNHR